MAEPVAPSPVSLTGTVLENRHVSSGLIRLDLELKCPVDFLPGQFAMLNLADRRAFVFSRPFSILAVDGPVMSFLYRVVGVGTAALAELAGGEPMVMLGPLGRPFPSPEPGRPVVLVGGGVGLPPVAAWLERYGRPGDAAYFGARDGGDVPWDLLDGRWAVSVDSPTGVPAGREAFHGLVTELASSRTEREAGPGDLMACGPEPLLKASARLAAERGWRGWLSLEEHMGCGYGACKGCVVAVKDESRRPEGWRTATSCQEGPVFAAEDIVWGAASAPAAGPSARGNAGGDA